MARDHNLKNLNPGLPHLPTAMLLIGYAVFWLELYVFKLPEGKTTPLATIFFILFAGHVIWSRCAKLKRESQGFWRWLQGEKRPVRRLIVLGLLILLVTLAVALYAALLPPHLLQESDVLMYHLAIPRQHLIAHSFRHIPWSTADLYFLPVDFALAPYWLMTPLPNKFPQFLFQVAFIAMSVALAGYFTKKNYRSMIIGLFALGGSHVVGIQLGTGMLDLVVAYLFLAALHSLLAGSVFWAAVEITFYSWAKSFMPLQTLLFVLLFATAIKIASLSALKITWLDGFEFPIEDRRSILLRLKKVSALFLLMSLFVAGPFVSKSLFVAGTPVFPFAAGRFPIRNISSQEQPTWAAMQTKAHEVLAVRDQYGAGRSLSDLLAHLWLIAVPERGVINRFDHPVGLPYLLCLAPFFFCAVKAFLRRETPLLPLGVILLWAIWWMGSHQSRFFVLPLVMLFLVVAAEPQWQKNTLVAMLTVSLMLVFISVFRAHRQDLGRWGCEVLREKDQQLIKMSHSQELSGTMTLSFPDVAYASFPVEIDLNGEKSAFVIKE